MGLWFELPVTIIESHPPPTWVESRLHVAKGGPHMTVAHLGDLELDGEAHARELQIVAQEVIDEMRVEFSITGAWTLDVTGSGRFLVGPRDCPVDVLLVQNSGLGLLYDMLQDALSSRCGIAIDYTYQWVPHVTLGKGDPVVLQRRFQVTATTLDLVHSKSSKERGRWRTNL